jgi:hypothetical protein
VDWNPQEPEQLEALREKLLPVREQELRRLTLRAGIDECPVLQILNPDSASELPHELARLLPACAIFVLFVFVDREETAGAGHLFNSVHGHPA